MIKLDDFIKNSLVAIVRGMKEAQQDSKFGEYIAPEIQGEKRQDRGIFVIKGGNSGQATIVEFEVDVKAETTKGSEGSGQPTFDIYVVNAETSK